MDITNNIFFQCTKAKIPPKPKNKKSGVPGRVRWFIERCGSLSESTSIIRLRQALLQQDRTLTTDQHQELIFSQSVKLLRKITTKTEKRRPLLIDHKGKVLTCNIKDLEKRKSLGTFGPQISIDKVESPSILILPFDRTSLTDLDISTAHLTRWDEKIKCFSLVESSFCSDADDVIIGQITKPGIYQPVALPKNPWLVTILETFCIYWPWLRVQPALLKKFPQQKTLLNEKICQLILCSPDFFKNGDEMIRLGLGEPPDFPDIIGGAGNICDQCTGNFFDFGDFPGGIVYEPPELILFRWWRCRCNKWISVGPFPGDDFWGIGRITQVDIHPTDGDILIAGAAGGGVWKTEDGGDHWKPLMETEPTLTIGGVAFAPSNPNVLYAASGEDAGIYNPAWPGVGVYRSIDSGKNWTLQSTVDSTRFSAIVVHPTDPNVIYVAGDQGLHKSTDGGTTWITNPSQGSLFDGQITDVVIAHDDPDRIYIGVVNNGVYRSTVGGEQSGPTSAFTRLDSVNQLPFGSAASWIKLAIGRNDTSGSNFVVTKLGPSGSRIFTTTDGGNTWTEQASNVASVSFDEWASIIAVDPQNENKLYAGAGSTLKRSDDGGTNWSSIYSNVHPDQQDLVFDPNDSTRIFLANDGGIFRSDDSGSNWVFASGNMRTSQLYDLDISQRNSNVIACAAQDNGVYYRDNLGKWRNPSFFWDGTQIAIDSTDPKIIYYSGQNGITFSNLTKSIDGGITSSNLGTSGLSGGSPWVTIIKLDPTDPITDPKSNRILFVCGTNNLFRSTKGGDDWKRVNDSLGNAFTTYGNITALEFSASDPSVLYLGTSAGALYRASNGGVSASDWTRIDVIGSTIDVLFPNTIISSISIDPNDPQHVWIVFAGNGVTTTARPNNVLNPLGISHVFKTIDGGTNWEDASGIMEALNLPDVPTSAVAIDNLDRDVAFVGTDVGVFRTADGGTTWSSFQEGLARSPVSELRLHRNSRILYASTMGRGVYRRKL